MIPTQERRLLDSFKMVKPENPDVEAAICRFEKLMPSGSLYSDNSFIHKLIEVNYFKIIASLQPLVSGFKMETLVALGQIVNKFTNESDLFEKPEIKSDIEEYIEFIMETSAIPGLPVQTSHNFHAKGVFLLTCANKERGAVTLYETAEHEFGISKPFNAGHAMLDWLYCITDDGPVNREAIVFIFKIIKECFDQEAKLEDSEITIGLCKSTIWLLSNLNYFYASSATAKERFIKDVDFSKILTPRVLSGLTRTAKLTVIRAGESGEAKYLKKAHEMVKTAFSFIFGMIDAPTNWDAIRILASSCPYSEYTPYGALDPDEPLKIIGSYKTKGTLLNWVEKLAKDQSVSSKIVESCPGQECTELIFLACYTLAVGQFQFLEAPAFLADACRNERSVKTDVTSKCLGLYEAVSDAIRSNVELINQSDAESVIENIGTTWMAAHWM